MSPRFDFFWIASQRYISEARRSADSVRAFHPEATLTLFTPHEKAVRGDFDRIVKLEKIDTRYWYLESTYYMNKALSFYKDNRKIVYLDTDTYVCASLDGIFQVLNKFDYVGAHAPGRRTAPTINSIPDSFPEYNIGVQGIYTKKEIRNLFAAWLYLYIRNSDIYENNDQAPLRETIWIGNFPNIRFGVLPIEYNYRFGMGGQVRGEVRVLHGRSRNYQDLEKIINAQPGAIRAWKPGELK